MLKSNEGNMKKNIRRVIIFALILSFVFSLSTNAAASTRSIIGADNRTVITNTTSAPYRMVGKLRTTYVANGVKKTYGGTAFLISNSMIMTAAHCLYSKQYGNPVKVTFTPGETGTKAPYGTVTVKKIVLSDNYKSNPTMANDYAVAILDKPIGGGQGNLFLIWG